MRRDKPILSTVILIAFGFPACFGVGLHWIDGGDCAPPRDARVLRR